MTTSGALRRDHRTTRRGAATRDQALVAAGQIGAGVGNMAFSLLMARLLVPGAFAQIASFLALYSLLSLPGSSISAVASLSPERSARARPIMLWAGLGVGAVLAAGSPWIGPFLRLPVPMVVVLGASGPALGTLALERGRLYGTRRHLRLVSSFVAEPAVRLTIGVALAASIGGVGGAVGVVIAGYGALEVARRAWARHRARAFEVGGGAAPSSQIAYSDGTGATALSGEARVDDGEHIEDALLGAPASPVPPSDVLRARDETTDPARRQIAWTGAVFLLLAVVQNQDLLIANRVLSPAAAGQFAVISTLGGLAAFATLTVPLVLLPRAARGEADGLRAALGITTLLAGGILVVAVLAPGLLVHELFGGRYAGIARLVPPYILAMGLLGVSRVLAADRCGRHSARLTAAFVAIAAAVQAALIIEFGRDPRDVAFSTLAATVLLTGCLAVAAVGRRVQLRREVPSEDVVRLPQRNGDVVVYRPIDLSSLRLPPGRARSTVGGLGERLRRVWQRPETKILLASCVVGAVIRFIILRGLWLDEATSVHEATMSFWGMIHDLRDTDVHPPLYFTVLWASIRAFGTSQLAVRLPSIVTGILIIVAVYFVGKEAYDRRTGSIAAAIAAVSPILVWYSQEARMYSMLALFGLVAMWAQIRILKRHPLQRVGLWPWAVYVLATTAMVWTQYFGLLQLAVQQLVFVAVIVFRWRRGQPVRSLVAGWAVSAVVIGAALAPLVPFAYHQYVVNQNAGKGFGATGQVATAAALNGNHIGIYAALANFIWAVIGYQPTSTMLLLGALWPLGMLFALGVLGRRRQAVTTLIVLAVLGPAAAMFALGLFKAYLFDIRYVFPAVALLTVLIARVITGFVRSPKTLACVMLPVLLVLGAFLVNQQINGLNPRRYDFNVALGQIAASNKRGDVLLYNPSAVDLLVDYYAPHVKSEALGTRPPLPKHGHTEWVMVSRALEGGGGTFSDLDSGLKYLKKHSHLVATRHYSNVEVYVFR